MNTIDLNKKIGIWGFGTTGKSAANYFHVRGYHVQVLDRKNLDDTEKAFLITRNIPFFHQEFLSGFLEQNDYIVASPGIDIRPYLQQYPDKFLNELDFFYAEWNKPIIAITGSVGKTTITHLLSTLLQKVGLEVATGGNIGTPLFDLIALNKSHDVALLELSSFQLEHCTQFAPDLAIITNLYPNHLDRHNDEQEYLDAKTKIFAHQKKGQQALISWGLKDKINGVLEGKLHYFSSSPLPSQENRSDISKKYYIENDVITVDLNGQRKELMACIGLPPITFIENWLIIHAIFDICKLPLPDLHSLKLTVPEHRLERVATINGVDFYNDSKSTTVQSTQAAIERLKSRPVLLLLGGLSKGVNRAPFIASIKNDVKKIYCFGAEAKELKMMCDAADIQSASFANLDTAFAACVADMQSGDQILLSPAGSSYDLYKIYTERGDHFKKLVGNIPSSRR